MQSGIRNPGNELTALQKEKLHHGAGPRSNQSNSVSSDPEANPDQDFCGPHITKVKTDV